MPAPEFEIIDLSATGAEGQVRLSAVSRLGAVHGVPRPLATPIKNHVDNFRGAVRAGLRRPSFLPQIEQFLSDLVFGVPEIRALFHRSRGAAAESGRPMLLRLMAAPHPIAALPWELLLDPEEGPHRYLTLAPDVHIVRLARVRTYLVQTAPIPPPLKMLLILSSPLGAGRGTGELAFDMYEEKRALLSELGELVNRGLLEVDVEDRPTLANLRGRIAHERRGYNIVHYVGHGRPETLMMEDERGQSTPVPADTFNGLLRACRDLRLIVFSACQSAEPPEGDEADAWPGLLSLADRCVRDASPVVLGMQAVLPFTTERLLARYFYRALAAGRTIADAMTLARSAIFDDPHCGKGLLDWAVPSLFVGGEVPSRIVDPDIEVKRRPAPRVKREDLRLDLIEGDREFFARHAELRHTIDFLAGRGKARCLWVLGPPGVGKTRLVGRALRDVDQQLDFVLYVTLDRLLADDPVHRLCTLVMELLDRRPDPPAIDPSLPPADRWDRIIEAIVERPIAIVIDNVHGLQDAKARDLRDAIRRLIGRDTRARLLLVAEEVDAGLAAPDALSARVQLQHIGWDDVWQWIRRNRPVLTRFDSPSLLPLFPQLGPRLQNWSELADEVDASDARNSAALEAIVKRIVAQREERQRLEVAHAPSTPSDVAAEAHRRPTGIRVAIAGPFSVGRHAEFAAALTELAYQHAVRGRVSADPDGDPLAPMATLLTLKSPFGEQGTSSNEDIVAWLDAAAEQQANIVLADFGSPEPGAAQAFAAPIRRLEQGGALVLAAGSNDKKPIYPGWMPEVLAVGPLGEDGTIAAYSHWDKARHKPDIFAPDHVRGTPLARAVSDPDAHGSSFAALHVLAAAVLALAADPSLKPNQIRGALLDCAEPIAATPDRCGRKGGKGAEQGRATESRPLRLNVEASLKQVRAHKLIGLTKGATSVHDLSQASGLSADDIQHLAKDPAKFLNAEDLASPATAMARVVISKLI